MLIQLLTILKSLEPMSNTLASEVSFELLNCLVEQLPIVCHMNAKLIIYQVYCA